MALDTLSKAIGDTIDLSVGDIIAKFGGDKRAIALAAQKGEIDPTKAVMAGMAVDRVVASAAQPQNTTVAEDVLAQPQPAGLGAMAPQGPQMGQPQMPPQAGMGRPPAAPPPQGGQGLNKVPVPQRGFADGGIVGFQAGGRSSLQDVLSQMSYMELQEYQRTGRLPEKYRMMVPGAEPTFTQALRDANQADTGAQYGARPIPGSQVLAQKADAAGNIYAGGANPLTGLRAIFGPKAKMGDEGIIEPSATDYLGQGVPTERQVDPFSATERFTGDTAQTDPGEISGDLTTSDAIIKKDKELAEKKKQLEAAKPKPTDAKPPAEDEAEKPKSYDDYLKEVMDRMGPSTVGKDMRDEIAKDRKARKEDQQNAMWMRVVEAGLGIMGGESPYALVNIGKGATNALRGYADDLREQKKLDREDRRILLDIEKAERAELRDNYRLASESYNKALDRMSAEKRSQIAADASRYTADVQERIGKAAYGPGGLKPSTEATIRNNASQATEGRLLLDPKFREAQKRKDQAGMIQRRNEIFTEELRKLTPGGGAGLNTSALGQIIDFQTALGAR